MSKKKFNLLVNFTCCAIMYALITTMWTSKMILYSTWKKKMKNKWQVNERDWIIDLWNWWKLLLNCSRNMHVYCILYYIVHRVLTHTLTQSSNKRIRAMIYIRVSFSTFSCISVQCTHCTHYVHCALCARCKFPKKLSFHQYSS